MIHVRAPSRLHFGLLSLPADEGSWARQFGGIGLMIEEPGVSVSLQPAESWSAEGFLAERALAYAKQIALALSCPQRFQLNVEASAAEHVGLGTGTQLGLAVARALALVCGHKKLDAVELAYRLGRGKRSALGVYGFARGGF